MKLGKFSECKIIAGHKGMEGVIENITIMEVPDIVKWLKGRELILTSLYAIKDDLDAQNLLIQRLYYAGATALAIKPFQSMECIPEGIIESANKLGFPVIQIPDHVKYLDILSPVMHHIFNKNVVLQENLEQATNVLQEISLDSQGVDVFIETVSNITKNIITIESEFSFIVTLDLPQSFSALSEDRKYELAIIKRPVQYERKYGQDTVSCLVAPIIVDDEYYGNITCWAIKGDHLAIDLAVLEKASSLLSLEFLRLKVKYDVEQQYKNDFMKELLFNETISEKDLAEWGAKYHVLRENNYVCMLLDKEQNGQSDQGSKQLNKVEVNSLLQKKWPTVLVGDIRTSIYIILSVEEESLHTICEDIANEITHYKNQNMPICLGVGEIYKGPQGIRKSFLQAEQTLQLTKKIKMKKGIMYYRHLGAFRLLKPLMERRELIEFYEDTIEKLVVKDTKTELLNTLRTFLYYNEVLKDTANALYIHVNTLKYRIKKIEEITGCDFRKTEEKLNIFLGLKIYDLLSSQKDKL